MATRLFNRRRDINAAVGEDGAPQGYGAQLTKTAEPEYQGSTVNAKRMSDGSVKYWSEDNQSWIPAKTMQSKDGKTYWFHPEKKTFLPLEEK